MRVADLSGAGGGGADDLGLMLAQDPVLDGDAYSSEVDAVATAFGKAPSAHAALEDLVHAEQFACGAPPGPSARASGRTADDRGMAPGRRAPRIRGFPASAGPAAATGGR